METHLPYFRRSYLQDLDSWYDWALSCGCVRNLYLILITAIVFAITIILGMSTVMANELSVTKKPTVTMGAEQSEPTEPGIYKGDLRNLQKPKTWNLGNPVRIVPKKVRPQKEEPTEVQKSHKDIPYLDQKNLSSKERPLQSFQLNGQLLNYRISSSDLFPSIRYAGRHATDPLGMLRQDEEASIIEGQFSQIGITRWGDYSSMNVDPADDCTFWYTQEYVANDDDIGFGIIGTWGTRIASFRFPSCGSGDFSTPDINIEGIPFTGAFPPDTVGDVGPNHYIQMVNNGFGGSLFAIYDKRGSLLAGPTSLQSLWTEGGPCSSGFGDPIVLYDSLADRWLMSEFVGDFDSNHLCVYISQTSDPITGGWFLYDFEVPEFPDYPKYAVWSDAYYVSSNESSPAVYALDRNNILAGNPATYQRFTAIILDAFPIQALVPSDLDGATLPPTDSPNYFMRHRDDEAHNPTTNNPTQDFLEIWEFHVDFDNPANSTFTGPFNIPISEFDSELCGLFPLPCIPQPGTFTRLDPVKEVIMWRSQYRNFATHETLVGNFVIDVDETDHGGIRWFELRRTDGGLWNLFQEGTYAPDDAHRWMGSIAMDKDGNIALGYSVAAGEPPVIDPNEPNDNFIEATSIMCPSFESVDTVIDPFGDVDYYLLTGTSREIITIDIDAAILGSPLYSTLGAFDSSFNLIAFSDINPAPDEDFSTDSFLQVRMPEDGLLYIAVSSFADFVFDGTDAFTIGPYNLSVSCAEPPPPPMSGDLLGSTGNVGGVLIDIDPTTGIGTFRAPHGMFGPVTEIEFRSDGTLIGATGAGTSTLIEIDLVTGEETFRCFHESGALNGLEFIGDTLYGAFIPSPGVPSELVIVGEPNVSGECPLTFLGPTGFGALGGLAFDKNAGILYGCVANSSDPLSSGLLVTCNRETGICTSVGQTGFAPCSALEFGPDGTLFGGFGIGTLFTINPTTGAGTEVGPTGFPGLSGLAFVPFPKMIEMIEIKAARFTFMHFPIQPPIPGGEIDYPDRLTISGYLTPPDGISVQNGGTFCDSNTKNVLNNITVTITANTPLATDGAIQVFSDTLPAGTLLSACSNKFRYKGMADPNGPNPNAKYDLKFQPRTSRTYFSISVDEESFFQIIQRPLSEVDCAAPPACKGCPTAPTCSAYLDFIQSIVSFDTQIQVGTNVWTNTISAPLILDALTCCVTPSKQELKLDQ